MKIAFCTYVNDKYFYSMGAYALIKSMKYFHPEIPVIHHGDGWLNVMRYVPFGLLHPFAIQQTMDMGFDAVIYVDADSLITGPLSELITAMGHYDVVGVRNNNDYHMAGKDEPIAQPNSGTEHYWNAGLVATNNRAFVRAWAEDNLKYGTMLPFKEQSVLNVVKNEYSNYMVDAQSEPVYYGVSALSGEESHWDSWKDIIVDSKGSLLLNDKRIKVLHQAGGGSPYKMGFHQFNDETVKRLTEIVR